MYPKKKDKIYIYRERENNKERKHYPVKTGRVCLNALYVGAVTTNWGNAFHCLMVLGKNDDWNAVVRANGWKRVKGLLLWEKEETGRRSLLG